MLNVPISIIFLPFAFLIVILLLLDKFLHVPSSNHPPSPPKLPIIGNLHQLGTLPHRSLHKLSKKYGPLMQLHLGKKQVLIISSPHLAYNVLKTNDLIFSSRPKSIFPDRLLYGSLDVAFAPYGECWRKARRICVRHLLGAHRVKSYCNVREDETSLMVQKIEKMCKLGTLNLSELFVCLTNDIVCRVALGRKYSDRQDWKELIEIIKMLGEFNIEDYIPWLGYFVNYVSGWNGKLVEYCKKNDEFLELVIEEHRKKMENIIIGGDDCVYEDDDDFVDILLKLQSDDKDESIQKETIKAIIWDMFAAGTDSTRAVLDWAMSELLRNPKTMAKLQYEIRQIAQEKPNIFEDDTLNMKYLKAVIKETLRLHPSAPLLIPRETTHDVKLMGYNIKSGTRAIINCWAIGRDPSYWDNADVFEPERFLNCSSDFIREFDFALIPFGAGRRGCPGAAFGVAVIELALAKLVHKFDFSLPGELKGEDLDMTDTSGIVAHRKFPLLANAVVFGTASNSD